MTLSDEHADNIRFSITPQQAKELADLAAKLCADAGHCLEQNHWIAALVQISGSAEAALLATVCIFEPELREQGLWHPPKGDPTRWTLGQLAEVARRAGWLPVDLSETPGEIFTNLDGQIGDALRFVERIRNMVVHPGAYVRETVRPVLEDEQHMQLTYKLIDGIIAIVFEQLTAQINTLENS